MESSIQPRRSGTNPPVAAASGLFHKAALTVVGLVLIGIARAAARITSEAWFGLDGLGLVTIALSVATIVTIFGAAGMSPGITKLLSELRGAGDDRASDQFAGYVARRALIFSIVGAFVASGYIVVVRPESVDSVATAGVAIGVLTLTYGAYLAGKAIAYGEGSIRRYVALEIAGFGMFVIGLVVAWWISSSVALIGAMAAAYVPVAWLSLRRLTRALDRDVSLPRRSFLGYGAVSAVGAMAGVGFTYVTPLAAAFVAPVVGPALVGAALTVLEPLNLAPRAIGLVLLPDTSHALAAGDRRRGASALKAATGAVAALATPVCALLVLERDRVLGVLFSDAVVGGMNLAWFSAAFFVSVVGSSAITALAAIDLRKASISMWSSLVGFGVAIVIWITASQSLSTAAIGLGYLVGSIIQVAAPLVAAQRFYRPDWGSFWVRLAVAAALTTALAFFPVSLWLDLVCVAVIVLLLSPELRAMAATALRRGQSSEASS